MLNAPISEYKKYAHLEQKLRLALDFLSRDDLRDYPEGWVELGGGVRASFQRYTTAPAERLRFETHEHAIDVQFVLSGEEIVQCAPRVSLPGAPAYDAENDITFYDEPASCVNVVLHEGDYVILPPEDGHKPRCTLHRDSEVRKIIVKVPV